MKHIIKKLWILLLILTAGTSAFAQSPKFIVYFVSGKCSKIVAGKTSTLKKGDKLQSADKVKITTGGKAILICSNFNTTQLNTPKEYKVGELYTAALKTPPTFTASYFHFIWDEFSHPHSSPESEPEKYMKTAGAVTRGKEPVDLLLQTDTIKYFNGPLSLKFSPQSDSVYFTLQKVESKRLTQIRSAKLVSSVPLSAYIPANNGAGNYQWQLADIANPKLKGGAHILIVYPEAEYKQAITMLLNAVVASGEAETAFMKAFLLEKHHYLAEASKYYQLAAKMQPDNKVYRQLASRF